MRIACAQSNVHFSDSEANAKAAIEKLRDLKAKGVDLVVFPEAYLTGYCVSSTEEAKGIAIPRSAAALESVRAACEEIDILAVMGFAEMDGETVFNTAVLFEPGIEPRYYRKTHLPDLGLDKFVQAGCELPVFETRLGKVGILICFDLRPPEATRVLALAGAELIILPTNWPVGAEVSAQHVAISRASENRVFVATCNRVGEENGFRFIGLSKIIGVGGQVFAAAGDGEEVIVADLELSEARQKRTITIPGKYETEVFASRQPDLYASLTTHTP